MRITFLTANWVNLSGGVRVVSIYAERLRKRGHEVFVVCPALKKPTLAQQMRSILKGQGWIPNKQKGASHFDNLDVPRQILDHEAPITDADLPDADVVIACLWTSAEWVANLSVSKGAKAYFIQHHETHDYFPIDRVKATYRLPLHKITISNWLVDLMKTEYNDHHISLVYNSVDTEQFYSPPRGKQSVPTVGMMYSPAYWKGCDISLKAFSLAQKKIPNLRLVAFGKQKPSPNLVLPTGTEYYQQPPQFQIKDIYNKSDVWICGSWKEGFHLPPLEAMACRCPVVSTRVGGPMDILVDGENGYIVDVGDFTALADRLVDVLSLSDAQWQVMSNACYETACRYTWEDATDLFEAALHTAIERQERGDFS